MTDDRTTFDRNDSYLKGQLIEKQLNTIVLIVSISTIKQSLCYCKLGLLKAEAIKKPIRF